MMGSGLVGTKVYKTPAMFDCPHQNLLSQYPLSGIQRDHVVWCHESLVLSRLSHPWVHVFVCFFYLQEGRAYLSSQFQRLGPIAFGPVMKQSIMGSVWWSKAAHLMALGKQRAQKGWGANAPTRACPMPIVIT